MKTKKAKGIPCSNMKEFDVVMGHDEPKPKHIKVPYGLCKVCGHYGDDCEGTKPPHTPTPWTNDGRFLFMSDKTQVVFDNEADAAYTRKAVNNFDGMLTGLHLALSILRGDTEETEENAIAYLKQEIAKAEGK